jgi:hypothetical protein
MHAFSTCKKSILYFSDFIWYLFGIYCSHGIRSTHVSKNKPLWASCHYPETLCLYNFLTESTNIILTEDSDCIQNSMLVWFTRSLKNCTIFNRRSILFYRGYLIERIESSNIFMDCFSILQLNRICSKRLHLLGKKVMCLWQLQYVFNLCRNFLHFSCDVAKRFLQRIPTFFLFL